MSHLLLFITIINLVFLTCWFAFFALGRNFIYRTHSRWFKLSEEQFDTIHYCGMGLYKVLIIMFNIVPLIAIWIIER